MSRINDLLTNLFVLQNNLTRQFALNENLQLVHLHIIQYLAKCNKYSDTTQAISAYLGQTKSSISQSLSILEKSNIVERKVDSLDKRIFHLSLTKNGKNIQNKLENLLKDEISEETILILEDMLKIIQKKNNIKSFGVCSSCKFHLRFEKNTFRCGLLNEVLLQKDISKICKEHTYS